ncbi:DJ-1/PfpI family protein [Chelativorans sp. EGI FJ00035]|uniref:DJ-1/PfpI family protein n=1 Tax=Chelativorans salis TaxID=2978478 RepID=A0ABT2LI11_9HYPH|nr:DJ-1/PfpI family protein [Chelativorans sp. EGI FJ00035]
MSILAVPDTFMSCLSGIFDTLIEARDAVSRDLAFEPEIVAATPRIEIGKSRMPLDAHRTLDEIDRTDIVIVAASVMDGARWTTARYGEVVGWLRLMHDRGAILCSACSGALLLAETGLLDGEEATTHWALERYFKETFPKVRLRLERELVVSGADGRLVMSGASTVWHDLTLYLIARFNGPATARAVAKYFMLQWHADSQGALLLVRGEDHGDAAVLAAQKWLQENWREQAPSRE